MAGNKAAKPKGRFERAQDWAILLLAKDLGDQITPLPTLPFDSTLVDQYRQLGTFAQAGYSRDRPHMLTRNSQCTIAGFRRDGYIAMHECDATFGDSGSPLLLEQDGRYRIVAMLVAINRKNGKGIAVTGKAFHERARQLDGTPPAEGGIKAGQGPAHGNDIGPLS